MKTIAFAVLLTVVPSALRAQFVSLENAAEKTTTAANSDIITAKGLTAMSFDGAATEGRASVVVADNGASALNKKDIPLAESRKINLTSEEPGVPKEKNKGGFKEMMNSESGSIAGDFAFGAFVLIVLGGIGAGLTGALGLGGTIGLVLGVLVAAMVLDELNRPQQEKRFEDADEDQCP